MIFLYIIIKIVKYALIFLCFLFEDYKICDTIFLYILLFAKGGIILEQTKTIYDNIKYLKSLSKTFPSIQSVSTEIINLKAILDLPKGTEHFVSDIHGENEAFVHILNSASGVIHEKIDILYSDVLSLQERKKLATLIYYPAEKLRLIKAEIRDMPKWYTDTLIRLIEICRLVASKYTRSKVRKALPPEFSYIIDELLHTGHDGKNKEKYYNEIIKTIIEIDRADAFIIALSAVIKRLAVDRLHVVGDIFDRGDRPDIIMDMLMKHHSVDIQWGNHDILWMGAAAGSEACISNVLNICLRFSALDLLEIGYGISLRSLITFAETTYSGECKQFKPKQFTEHLGDYDKLLLAKMRKAITVILFKEEGQIIKRNDKFEMEPRLLLDKIDYKNKTVLIDGVSHPILDTDFPTIDPSNPYELTNDEEIVINELKRAFMQSEKLQKQISFLYSKGSIYKCFNSNLLYHGCVPMNSDGSFTELNFDGNPVKGKEFMDYCDLMARKAFFMSEGSEEKQKGKDFIWYLWCGKHSPLFGRHAMTTFERCEIADENIWKERKDPYYTLTNDPEYCRKILAEFGLDPYSSHIINGHVPVKTKDGESPFKANGKLINIDGGFCKHYQKTTGIAGYTLIYNSYCLRLISHEPFKTTEYAIENDYDIVSTSHIFETVEKRKTVGDTDTGKELNQQIDDLILLLKAYRLGIINEIH